MDYETVTTEQKLTQVNSAITTQEQQHYQSVLEKIANTGNAAAVRNIEAQLRAREQAIIGLRAERDRLEQLAAGPDASPGSPRPITPAPTDQAGSDDLTGSVSPAALDPSPTAAATPPTPT